MANNDGPKKGLTPTEILANVDSLLKSPPAFAILKNSEGKRKAQEKPKGEIAATKKVEKNDEKEWLKKIDWEKIISGQEKRLTQHLMTSLIVAAKVRFNFAITYDFHFKENEVIYDYLQDVISGKLVIPERKSLIAMTSLGMGLEMSRKLIFGQDENTLEESLFKLLQEEAGKLLAAIKP